MDNQEDRRFLVFQQTYQKLDKAVSGHFFLNRHETHDPLGAYGRYQIQTASGTGGPNVRFFLWVPCSDVNRSELLPRLQSKWASTETSRGDITIET